MHMLNDGETHYLHAVYTLTFEYIEDKNTKRTHIKTNIHENIGGIKHNRFTLHI